MSVIAVHPRFQERRADDESGYQSWSVHCNSKWDDPILFIGALQAENLIPYRGDGHPYNPFLKSTGPKVKVLGSSALHWIVESEYKLPALSEKEKESQDRADTPNPIDRAPKITRSYEKVDKAITKDRNGDAILNAAGDPYLDPVVVQETYPVWTVRVNLEEDPEWMDSLADKVNESSLTIRGRTYPKGQVLFEPGDVTDSKTEAGVTYYEVSFRLLINRRGWKERRYQNGMNEITDDGVKRKIKLPTKDDDGNELDYDDEARDFVSDPQMLDENGKLIEEPDAGNVEEHEIEVYEEGSFTDVQSILS